ncbi:MAG TPA: ABC transporter permease, partial [Gemmatimonadaceae bacterium]|nr:ABC transporter permease [Gemmatimonadaceae bacterium]
QARDVWSARWIESFVSDVRFALRQLRKAPTFAAAGILTLTLGIGATTTMFSVLYGVLLRPLPFEDASRLVVLHETTPLVGTVSVSYPDFSDWRAQSRQFSQLAFVHDVGFTLGGVARPESLSGDAVSANLLSMLGVRPLLGRDFTAAEERPGTNQVAMLSYALWQSRFGGNPDVLGRTLTLDGRAFAIVGVLPPAYRFLHRADVLVPIGVWRADDRDEAEQRGRRGDSVVVGRLAPAASLASARGELQGIASRLETAYPATNDRFGVQLESLRDVLVGDVRPTLLVLGGAVLLVLLVACANVANLLLSRDVARAREIALRSVFGASRMRIAAQMLTESLVFAALGGCLGLLAAVGGVRALTALMPEELARFVSLNGFVLLFTAGVIVLVTLLFGIAPAMHFARPHARASLREDARTASAGVQRGRWRALLAASEIALALVLLAGAGLMTRSLVRLLSVDPGFRVDHLLTATMDLPMLRYADDGAKLRFWSQLLERLQATPGVETAALGTVVPFTGNHNRGDITIEGMALPSPGSFPHPDYHLVSPGYVRLLGITVLRGRTFTDADIEGAPRVGLINAHLAEQYFPGQNPIGKRFMLGHPAASQPPEWITIVGEVGDTKLYGLANPSRLEIYLPYRQAPAGQMNLLVRSAAPPASLTTAIRDAVASIDKDEAVPDVTPMDDLRMQSVGNRRTALILLGIFSALALLLAAIGIYGVIAYSVAQRGQEIGIRAALGAQQGDILAMVLAQGGRIALVGALAGLVVAAALTRLMSGLLYSVSAFDPVTFASASGVLVAVAMLASYVPARRAARVDPMVALRCE